MKPKYPDVHVPLTGENGNAFALMGAVVRELKRAKVSTEVIEQFKKEATASDYDHLLQTVLKWVDVL